MRDPAGGVGVVAGGAGAAMTAARGRGRPGGTGFGQTDPQQHQARRFWRRPSAPEEVRLPFPESLLCFILSLNFHRRCPPCEIRFQRAPASHTRPVRQDRRCSLPNGYSMAPIGIAVKRTLALCIFFGLLANARGCVVTAVQGSNDLNVLSQGWSVRCHPLHAPTAGR